MGNHYEPLFTRKIPFFPMLCSRPSLKDVNLPQPEIRSESLAGDPQSPRITCIGQVKKRNTFNQTTTTNNVKYHKLKKTLLRQRPHNRRRSIFSGGRTQKRQSQSRPVGPPGKGLGNDKYFCPNMVDLDMDPPLPVVKKAQNIEEIESLWNRRRSGGAALRSLELLQIPHFRPHLHLHLQTTSI